MKVTSGLRLRLLNRRANLYILAHPLEFALGVLKCFRANQGLLLAGAVAYYALLSIVPFLMLVVVVLSHFLNEAELLLTMRRYLELLLPGQSSAIVTEVAHFLDERDLITWVLVATMLFIWPRRCRNPVRRDSSRGWTSTAACRRSATAAPASASTTSCRATASTWRPSSWPRAW